MTAAFIATDRLEGRSRTASGADEARAVLDRLWARCRDFIGTELAIMGGAMTWVSERNLVAAISNAGGFGVIASGSMSPDLLAKEIEGTAALTDRPFGVNLITMHPQLVELVDVCLAHSVGHVVLAGGIPPGAAIARIRDGVLRVPCALRRRWCWPRSWCAAAPRRLSSRAAKRAAISARSQLRCWRRRCCRI